MRIFRGSGRRALLVLCAVALAVAFVLPAGDANALSTPIGTKISLIKPLKLYKIVSKPTVLFPLPTDDLAVAGGSVTVTAYSGGTLVCTLAAQAYNGTEGWKGLGNPAGSKGWKYINKSAPGGGTAGDCKLVLIKEKVIKVLAKDTGSLAVLGPGDNSYVFVQLDAGTDGYCALATPPHFKEIAGTLLKMKDQLPPPDCVPPSTTTTTSTTTTIPPTTTVPTTTTTGGATTTTTLCDCSGFDYMVFETTIGSGTAGTLRNFKCSGGDPDFVDNSCDPDLGNAGCDFRPCFVGPNFCSGDYAISCTTDAQCQGTCAELTAGNLPLALEKGGLYTGGGLNSVPLPFPVPDQGVNVHNISGSQTLTLTATTPAQVGQRQCTKGRTCTGGTNNGLHCVLPADCPGGTCTDNCVFGPPLPIPNAGTPATSVCAVNVVDIDSSGTAECAGGDADVTTPLRSVIYLNGDLLSSSNLPDLPGVQPCPLCVRICNGGSEDGLPCRPDNPTRSCDAGTNVGKVCLDNSDCPNPPNPNATCLPARTELTDCLNGGGTCPTDSECLGGQNDGAACTPATSTSEQLLDPQDSYPTSHDCLMDSLQNITANIGGLPIQFGLTSGVQTLDADDRANGERVFCGFCRDVTGGGSLCFEGSLAGGCPPSIPAATGNAVACNSDADCADADTYESCVQRDPGAFSNAAATRIEVSGETDGQCMDDGALHASTLVSIFCVPPTFDATVDAAGDLPGPGTALMVGNAQVQ